MTMKDSWGEEPQPLSGHPQARGARQKYGNKGGELSRKPGGYQGRETREEGPPKIGKSNPVVCYTILRVGPAQGAVKKTE